jgi:hypothetical protein
MEGNETIDEPVTETIDRRTFLDDGEDPNLWIPRYKKPVKSKVQPSQDQIDEDIKELLDGIRDTTLWDVFNAFAIKGCQS